jgi:serine protease Do
LHPEDPELSTISNTLDSEDQVVEWEKNGSTISLSLLLDHYLENKKSRKEYKNADQLLAKLNDEKNRIIAKYNSENFEEKSLKDPRFDHTVAIFTGESLGSGFYVTPDVVMTNYHVVDEAQFVELKKYDGTETFGRVIAKDARLDIALVSVQSRGVPVRFMTEKDLHPGDYIDVIGHPQGYEFTITRGIVSAIRRHSSIVASGGDDVLFVQTDADINPGNSGGPVFKGDLVIGVSDWGRSDSTGLNFLIHFSEVLNFLKGNLPGWKTS